MRSRTVYKNVIFYVFFGVLTTIINVAVFWLFSNIFEVPYIFSNIIAWGFSVGCAFVGNKVWVFQSNGWEKSIWVPEAIGFVSSRLVTGIIETLLMYIAISIMQLAVMWSKLVIGVFVIVGNFLLCKCLVFKGESK